MSSRVGWSGTGRILTGRQIRPHARIPGHGRPPPTITRMGEAAQVVARAAGKIPRPYVDEPQLSSPNRLAKALFDRVGAAVALVVAGPLLLVLALAVKATSDGPALYRQERVGLDGRRFRMWKIRTMHEDADQHRAHLAEQLGGPPLFKMVDDPRVTRIGRVLR